MSSRDLGATGATPPDPERTPPTRFERRIADAARALVRPLPPELYESIAAAARDPDTAHAAAARSLVRPAPLPFAELLQKARAAETDAFDGAFDRAIADAARSLRRPAPPELLDLVRAAARAATPAPQSPPRFRLLHPLLRPLLAAAATLVAGLALFFASQGEATAAPHPALLSATALARAESETTALASRADTLEAEVAADPALAADESLAPLLEEAAFLEMALSECRAALELSQAHSHLREQLRTLSERRVLLLATLAAARDAAHGGGAPSAGAGR
ncbi:MAG: hypothetical protein JNL90_19925 [Planctomycetes bacterium]|nr:hypothetical protein [Planctomycetota bacterium]